MFFHAANFSSLISVLDQLYKQIAMGRATNMDVTGILTSICFGVVLMLLELIVHAGEAGFTSWAPSALVLLPFLLIFYVRIQISFSSQTLTYFFSGIPTVYCAGAVRIFHFRTLRVAGRDSLLNIDLLHRNLSFVAGRTRSDDFRSSGSRKPLDNSIHLLQEQALHTSK